MPTTTEQAFVDSMTMFKAAWDAGVESSGIAVHWPNVRGEIDTARQTPTDAAKSWARVTFQSVNSNQRGIGSDGRHLYENAVLITVEVRVPTSIGSALAYRLVKVVLDAFRGKSSANGVRFMDCKPREVGNDGPWFRVDALIEAEYDEIA